MSRGKAFSSTGGDAKNLIRWCLQGDPSMRPRSMGQILSHQFFARAVQPEAELDMAALLSHDSTRSVSRAYRRDAHGKMRYHYFISHNQREASGDCGTLFHLFETRGVHCWRDMAQENLTEEGMKQGVKDSDIFVLFLTNSMLSRP